MTHDLLLSLLHYITFPPSSPPTGISSDPEDLDVRRKYYGSNVIEPKPPPSFLRLVFEALKDTTLIILQVAAVLSIVLSFFHAEAGVERTCVSVCAFT